MRGFSLLFAAAFVLFVSSGAFGEYYEYTDKDGTVRYTDDPSVIPDDQQEVKTFESIQSMPYQEEMTEEQAPNGTDAVETSPEETTPSVSGANKEKINELQTTQEELKQEFESLQAEKDALGPPPRRNARTAVRREYNDKVTELNRKIDEYHKRSKEFDERVKAYNGSQTGK